MSISVMSLVWAGSQHAGTELLMLLALADFSDDQGNSYPAVPTLATKCRMGSRNANYVLKALQDSGELEVRPNEGPRGTNRYRIVLEALKGVQRSAPLQASAPLQRIAPTPARHCAKPLQPAADEPSLNRQEPSKDARKRATRFEADSISLPEWLPAEAWSAWVADRKDRRKPITARAAEQQIRKLDAYRLAGHAPADVIAHSIGCGYQGLYAPKNATAPAMADDTRPAWAASAGFANRFEAENAGCFERNHHLFADGRRLENR